MAERLLVDVANGMKVSKPGVNVNFADDFNLLFSSNGSHFPVLQRGLIVSTNDTWVTAYFSKAYSKPPFVQFLVTAPGGTAGRSEYGTHTIIANQGPWIICKVFTNRIELKSRSQLAGWYWYYVAWDMEI